METVSIIKADSYREDLTEKITKLLAPLGGLGAFCKPGARVFLKPNLLMPKTPESAVLTHPALIMALVRLLSDQGCKVAIGDSPGMGSAENVIRKLGIFEELTRRGVEIVEFEKGVSWKRFTKAPAFERRFNNLELAGELLEYDQVINLPKLKSHGQMGITLATKNLFGCVVGHAKGRWHFIVGRDTHAFARILVEIALTVNAGLHILDGIVGMDGNGPSSGRPRELGFLMASANPVALDRMVVELIGKSPDQFPIFAAARELGVAGVEPDRIILEGGAVTEFQISDFEIPGRVELDRFANRLFSNLYQRLIRQRLVINHQACINCRKCEAHCPAKAIRIRKRVRIRESKCIKCCCCQEFCPVGAITLQDVWTAKLLRKITMGLS
ncbi:MAG: DUF362 domain-containing protein [Firmicutes bacterium]|nr:DUF362 domain-containing protein [Bacillota bacterium]